MSGSEPVARPSRWLVAAAALLAFLAVHVPATGYHFWVGRSVANDWAKPLLPTRITSDLRSYACPPAAKSPATTKRGGITKTTGVQPPASPAAVTCRELTPTTRDVLMQMRAESAALASASVERMKALFAWQYLALIAGLIAAALSAVWTFMFAAEGWAKSEWWAKAAFAVTGASLAFWLAVPQVFRYQQNIQTAEDIFVAASGLRNEIETFVATGRGADGNWLDPASFAWRAQAQLVKVRRVGVAFDQSRVGISLPAPAGAVR